MMECYIFAIGKILSHYRKSREAEYDAAGFQDTSINHSHRRAEETANKQRESKAKTDIEDIFIYVFLHLLSFLMLPTLIVKIVKAGSNDYSA